MTPVPWPLVPHPFHTSPLTPHCSSLAPRPSPLRPSPFAPHPSPPTPTPRLRLHAPGLWPLTSGLRPELPGPRPRPIQFRVEGGFALYLVWESRNQPPGISSDATAVHCGQETLFSKHGSTEALAPCFCNRGCHGADSLAHGEVLSPL